MTAESELEGAESRFVEAAGVRFHVLVLGAGRPVLMLHGFPENRLSFRHNAPALARAGYRVYVPDLKGYGLSDHPKPGAAHGDYRLSQQSSELGALIAALGHERLDIIGHDWGGALLSAMMLTARERIDRAVLMNAPLKRFSPVHMRHLWYYNLPSLPERKFWRAPEAFVRAIFDHWVAPANRHVFGDDEVRRYVRAFQKDGSITCALAYYRAVRADLAFVGRALTATLADPPKTLVLFGAADPIMPPMVARWAHADLPGSELVLVDGAGHFVHAEAPDRVNAELLRFLARP